MANQTNFPIIKPSLNLDFANTRRLDPRITFTRASTATYFDANGVMRTASNNEPRFDHNPVTGESLGLLIEEQRTNLLTYSEQFDNAAWSKNVSVTITPNAATAPDGTLTMDRMVEGTQSGVGAVRTCTQNNTITLGDYVTVFCVGKEVAGSAKRYLNISFAESGNQHAYARFDLATGLVTDSAIGSSLNYFSNINAAVEVLGDGRYKCILTVKTDGFTALQTRIGMTAAPTGYQGGASGFLAYEGDGTSGLYIWGAQLEVGAFPTSYIKTEASQVTRAADNAIMTGTNFSNWYNPIEGALFTFASCNSVRGTTDLFSPVIEISDNTNNEAIRIIERRLVSNDNDIIFAVRAGNVAQASIQVNPSNTTIGQFYKVAGAYKLNDFAGSFEGNTTVTSLSGTIPTVTQARLGRGVSGSLNGHIKHIAYYSRRLSDTQLQALTG